MDNSFYALQRHELRKLAENPIHTRWDDDKPDWLLGLVAILAFCCLLGWMDARDDAHYMAQAAEKAHRDAQEARQELQAEKMADSIKWVGKGFECRFRVERVWHQVFAKECERLGRMLADSRID